MAKKTKWIRASAVIMISVMLLSYIFSLGPSASNSINLGETPFLNLYDGKLETNRDSYFSSAAVQKLPSTVSSTDAVSVIISMENESLFDMYSASGESVSFSEFLTTPKAQAAAQSIRRSADELIEKLRKKGIDFTLGDYYDTLLSGFEIVITGKYYEDVYSALSKDADVILGDAYEKCDTELVENNVNVYDTGIFNSKEFTEKYGIDGSGMVIAVLDTGLDYTHTAFSPENFTSSKLGLTYEDVVAVIGDTAASELYAGLSAGDVYLNEKVPYSFDYADTDPDVFPIQSDHGTHVSGIIVGNNDVITGVAPNAQLVSMKIFSDTQTTARTSWILGALEDCVVLGVDVINLSIGTSCGFAHETEKEMVGNVYQKIRDAGISLIVAASNSYTSTYGSEKNGNLGLTSNPDNGTVGSPSTYAGALSIASISGTKTPYLLHNGKIVYFTESSDRFSEEKNFVDELLEDGMDELTIEYVKIPGVGRTADYTGLDVSGKIVLVKRGSNTFEDKVNTAEKMGAAGIIIYNNVSGEIKMNVGSTNIPACSIRQDAGEELAAAGSGTLTIKRSQVSGPFMSDFSSWGPNPDLEIKPELTAHGGSILSSVPGEDYDRISGTSMATPNVSGLTALVRQYVIENFPDIADDPVKVTSFVYQLLMSTADIVYNTNGLPYSVRKQGAGLANLYNSAATDAYIITYDKDGKEMDKSKIELGDDPSKIGVYELSFSVKNFGTVARAYNVSAYVMTEGVSETKTNDGKTTVTEQGYLLDGAKVTVSAISGGTLKGNTVTVAGGATADVTVTIALSDKDKDYLNSSFANGMYVEGFVVLDSPDEETVDLSVPYLGFFGDWTQAPLFDLDYFETNKDELDDSIDLLDKTLPDAYATRPIGGTELDYMMYLGSYFFEQDPSSTLIAADRKYIALSNQSDTVNSLRFVWGGLLRNAAKIEINITDDATGEVVYSRTNHDIRKSYGDGGAIRPANIEVEFSAIENNLKNNTTYTVTLQGFLDYGDGGADTNLKNTFTFPLYIDFEAPTLTGVEYYTEYDRSTKTNRLFAKIAVYDNHYAMCMQIGTATVDESAGGMEYSPTIGMFDRYMTPVYSEANSTTYVVYELTDYIDEIKQASHKNTFTVVCYDYALNQSVYEIGLPDDFTDVYFENATYTGGNTDVGSITLSPNEVFNLTPVVYPGTEWGELVEYEVRAGKDVVKVVNNQMVALKSGSATVIARPATGNTPLCLLQIKVLSQGEPGYKRYDKPSVQDFKLTGYTVDKAFYFLNTDERDIGITGDTKNFSGSYYSLSMFPSEAVSLITELHAYFPETTSITFKSSNKNIATVDDSGKIVAVAEGSTSITVQVVMDGKNTIYKETVRINVKDPYTTTGPILSGYYGNGGLVDLRYAKLSITEIGQYAFSNYDYIPKDENDIISEEEPDLVKPWYLGEDTITEVYIPDGVTRIGMYAFAGLTSLTTVHIPDSVVTIDVGAFYNCTSLVRVEGIENVKFFNQYAFLNTSLTGELRLDSAVAIGDGAFAQMPAMATKYDRATSSMVSIAPSTPKLTKVTLSDKAQSIGAYAFTGCEKLEEIVLTESKIKLGQLAFSGCKSLKSIKINAAVIPAGAFEGCSSLESAEIGKDVQSIGEQAFAGTKVASFTVADGNTAYKTVDGAPYLLSHDGKTLMLVAPELPYTGSGLNRTSVLTLDSSVEAIADAALSGNRIISVLIAPGVTKVGNYAMANCSNLKSVTLGKLTELGKYSFFASSITECPDLTGLDRISDYAFSNSRVRSVVIPNGVDVGEGAFSMCEKLETVKIGDGVTIGYGAFMLGRYFYTLVEGENEGSELNPIIPYTYKYTSPLRTLEIGKNVVIGDSAFMGAAELESITLGDGAIIHRMAFYNCSELKNIDLSKVLAIGDDAFSGDVLYVMDANGESMVNAEGTDYRYSYHAPKLTVIDLSSLCVQQIGENEFMAPLGGGAFAYCRELTTVKLGDSVTKIPERAFLACISLNSVNTENLESVGAYAFERAAFATLNLPKVSFIGDYAFVYGESLESVTLAADTDITVGEGAFAYAPKLATVVGFPSVVSVGDYSFAYTAITSADLSGARSIGEGAFMKYEDGITDFTVILGDELTSLGDNPFAFCRLEAFSTTVKNEFNGIAVGESTVYTYDISDEVLVIDGSLYRRVPLGLELVTFAGDTKTVAVADGTVRISALAFAGTDVVKVSLPYTLNSIGHKAFYGCNALSLVTFASYKAPTLEEEYDEMYFYTYENFPQAGDYYIPLVDGSTLIFEGLGIVKFPMYYAHFYPSTVFYGANFVDYIGHVENKLTLVRPTNGVGYDSFIYSQYFDTVFDGAAAADDITLEAIEAINRLPDKVSLADKPLVEAARAAYNKIATLTQQSLVTVYSKLTDAEKRIKNLEFLDSENQPEEPDAPTEPTPDTPNEPKDETPASVVLAIVFGALSAVLAGAAATFGVLYFKKKKSDSLSAGSDLE